MKWDIYFHGMEAFAKSYALAPSTFCGKACAFAEGGNPGCSSMINGCFIEGFPLRLCGETPLHESTLKSGVHRHYLTRGWFSGHAKVLRCLHYTRTTFDMSAFLSCFSGSRICVLFFQFKEITYQNIPRKKHMRCSFHRPTKRRRSCFFRMGSGLQTGTTK